MSKLAETSDEDSGDSYITDDSSEDPLPAIVLGAIEAHRVAKEKGGINKQPSKEVLETLREHFLSGKADYSHRGFIDCMEAIGAVPSAKDPLVYDIEYNDGYVGGSIGEEEHEAKVRLFRYREYIEYQASRGIRPGDDWFMSSNNILQYEGHEIHPGKKGDELTEEQLQALGHTFSMGFYYYTNFDNIMTCRGSNVKTGSDAIPSGLTFPKNLTMVQMEVSEGAIFDQCEELSQLYEDLGCPLGPKSVLNPDSIPPINARKEKGKRGKKKNGRGKSSTTGKAKRSGWGSHSDEITSRLTDLLDTFDEHFSGSDAIAAMLVSVAEMLVSATRNDPDVAIALVNDRSSNCGSIVIKLRAMTLKQAKESNRRNWWTAFALLTDLLGCSIATLYGDFDDYGPSRPEDLDKQEGTPATAFFFEKVAPELISSIKSSHVAEKAPALRNLERASTLAPHSRVLRLVGSKDTWGVIENACCTALKESKMNPKDAKQSSWQNYMKYCILCEGAYLLHGLCMRALTTEDKTLLTPIAPTALAARMVKRGVIPLLIDIAKADLGYPSVKAMEGLGAISRVKDCRTIMFQDAGGIELIRTSLSSTDGSMISPTFLLIIHLLWDEEWCGPLSSSELKMEKTAIRWGLFAMDRIIKRAEETKKRGKDMLVRLMALHIESFGLNEGEEKARKMQAIEEEQKKIDNHSNENWLGLETEANRDLVDFFLGRCLLYLSASCKLTNGLQQLLRFDGLSMLSLCLDNPIMDIKSASVGGVCNTIATLGIREIIPERFQDPTQLVRSTVIGLHRLIMEGERTQCSQLFLLLATRLKQCPNWRPYFKNLPLVYRQIAEKFIGRIHIAEPDEAQKRDPSDKKGNVNEKCLNYTGKLRKCDACGTLESKKGNFSQCSKCYQATYCSKECQISDWHTKHKAQCKQLRKARSGS